MVRFSVRSLAFMALSFVAAASPVAQGFNQPAAQAAAPAPAANYAAPAAPAAPAMPVAVDNRNREAAYQPVPNMAPQPAAGKPQEQCIMVACSAQECMKNMTPQEQTEFKAQCEEMRREELQKAGASGKSRIAAGGFEMNYYQMYTLEEAAQKGIRADGKTAFLSTMSPNNQAVGNRPAGKNLCCCCCPCCCCCCPCCCCCCKCCCCKCCCCCCPCCHCCCC
ncbi:hypothetical protein IWW55_002208 [Coemansia sp. RSA 2706]|nr:hypothetical protein IWW55_002208 [Coemansia sp. RSA 2706]